tara:strand:- start:12 stop:467 length:456 start_codon:yes stop_codon:yes gene_type:complete
MTEVSTAPQSTESTQPDLGQQFTELCQQLSQLTLINRQLITNVRDVHKSYRKQRQQIAKNKRTKKTNTKIHLPMDVSSKLAKFLKLSEPTISKQDAMKQISQYVKDNKLQIESDKRRFIPNKRLMTLFGLKGDKPKLTFVEINKYISQHFI